MATALVLVFLAACREDGSGALDYGDDASVEEWNALVGDEADFVFDDSVIRTYELTVDEADWEWLNNNQRLEEYRPAALLFEGEEYPDVAVRYKGFMGALGMCFDRQGNLTCKKLSLKLKFSEYDDAGRFYGLKRLNFHSMESDLSKMRDTLAYGLFRQAGVFAPRVSYAKLVVNGEMLGLFALVEQIDGQFTRSRFPDGGGGNLYKEIWPVHSEPISYVRRLKTNREEDPSVDKIIRFAQALEQATDETFPSVLEAWTDTDMLMNYLAVDRLIDNWDGILAWYCVGEYCFNHNYYWYEDSERDRVWLIPWDLDNTFSVPSLMRDVYQMPDWDEIEKGCEPLPVFLGIQGRPPACDDLIGRFSGLMWDPYVEKTRELLDGPFQIDVLHERIDRLAERLAPAIAEDPNGPTVAEWEAAVERLKEIVVTKRSYIESKVGP